MNFGMLTNGRFSVFFQSGGGAVSVLDRDEFDIVVCKIKDVTKGIVEGEEFNIKAKLKETSVEV